MIERAKRKLSQLEAGSLQHAPQGEHPALQALHMLNPDDFTPFQAHEALYRLMAFLCE